MGPRILVDCYSFLSREVPEAMVNPNKLRKGERCCLRGNQLDELTIFLGGMRLTTSAVLGITEEGEVTTSEGRYKLMEISPDYKEYLQASDQGIPILANWNIYGTKNKGYYLTADVLPQRKALKPAKIISQEGNFLTIRRMFETNAGEKIWADDEKVFICWSSMSEHAKNQIRQRGGLADIPYSDFENFNGIKSKPKL